MMNKPVAQTKEMIQEDNKNEKWHLIDVENKNHTVCGQIIDKLGPLKNFSMNPCPDCIKERMNYD